LDRFAEDGAMSGGDFRPTTLLSDNSPKRPIQRAHSLRTIGAIEDIVPRATSDDAVHETVFRYQLQQHAAAQLLPTRYYLALQGHNPGEDLLCRMRVLVSQVQPLSQCRVSARDGVIDRKTGTRGLIVEVRSLRWLHMAVVEVVGGYYATPWQAAAIRYGVEYDGGGWAVTRTQVLWSA
jgi:hypothetical protein